MNIKIRVFVETGSQMEAQKRLSSLFEFLSDLGSPSLAEIQKYWKIPEYYEIKAIFPLESGRGIHLPEVAGRLGTEWNFINRHQAIWNSRSDSTFNLQDAKWAEIEIME